MVLSFAEAKERTYRDLLNAVILYLIIILLCSFGLNQKNPRLTDVSRAGKAQSNPPAGGPPAGQANAHEQSLKIVNTLSIEVIGRKVFFVLLENPIGAVSRLN